MKTEDKRCWRTLFRQLLQQLPVAEARRQSSLLWARVEAHPLFKQAQTVLLFWSLADEVNTHEFVVRWAEKKRILLPCVADESLRLRQFCGTDKMSCGRFGIQEPDAPDFTDFDAIDLALVPALVFDRLGNRLGRGQGFYDRLLPFVKAPKLGVGYDFQLVERLLADEWDAPMDGVLTSTCVVSNTGFDQANRACRASRAV